MGEGGEGGGVDVVGCKAVVAVADPRISLISPSLPGGIDVIGL